MLPRSAADGGLGRCRIEHAVPRPLSAPPPVSPFFWADQKGGGGGGLPHPGGRRRCAGGGLVLATAQGGHGRGAADGELTGGGPCRVAIWRSRLYSRAQRLSRGRCSARGSKIYDSAARTVSKASQTMPVAAPNRPRFFLRAHEEGVELRKRSGGQMGDEPAEGRGLHARVLTYPPLSNLQPWRPSPPSSCWRARRRLARARLPAPAWRWLAPRPPRRRRARLAWPWWPRPRLRPTRTARRCPSPPPTSASPRSRRWTAA